MTHLAQRLRDARTKEELDPLIAEIPYARFLGLTTEALESGELVLKMRFEDHLIGDPRIPALHGGTLGALLESTAVFTVLRATDAASLPKTITLTVDYLRSGRAKPTFCAARVSKKGRTIVIVQAEAWQDERDMPVATANVHFLIRPTCKTIDSRSSLAQPR